LIQADQLPLFADDSADARIRLSAVYTALLTQRSERETALDEGLQPSTSRYERGNKPQSAVEGLNAEKQLVLLGGPGSGKSTFANFVAMSMAGELLKQPEPNLATLTTPLPGDGYDKDDISPQSWDHGALLPVLVTLRDLAAQLPTNGAAAHADSVWDFIVGRLTQCALQDYPPHLQQELQERGGLILLDGLDVVIKGSD
jgi:hypothetical protein